MAKSPLTTLVNIGPVIADHLMRVGISTPEEFLAKDPYEVFHEMKKIDPTLCRCALSAVIGASKGVKWNEIRKEAVIEFERKFPEEYRKTPWKGC